MVTGSRRLLDDSDSENEEEPSTDREKGEELEEESLHLAVSQTLNTATTPESVD